MDEEVPGSCLCVIACSPERAEVSIMDCPEHGMPQNLADTDYPGSTPKYGVMIHGFGETGFVAPLHDQQQIDHAIELAKAIGYKVERTVQICSLNSLEKIAQSTKPGQHVSLQYHKPGCIFSKGPHPGDCYVNPATDDRVHDV